MQYPVIGRRLAILLGLAFLIGAVGIVVILSKRAGGNAEARPLTPGRISDPSSKVEVAAMAGWPEGRLTLPFLGEIRTRVAAWTFNVQTADGGRKALPLILHYDPAGLLIRAEYQHASPKEPIFPVSEVEFWYQQRGQRVIGIPVAPMGVGLQKLLHDLPVQTQLSACDRLEVTYQIMKDPAFTARPVIVVTVIGVVEGLVQSSRLGSPVRRVRYVHDENGKLLFIDKTA